MMECIIRGAACVIGVGVAAMSASMAQTTLPQDPPRLTQTDAEWTKDVTVLVIAPNGTWGTATEPFIDQAHAEAIADCKGKYGAEIGCGYRYTAIRAGWSFALRCGRESIIVAAKTLYGAEQAAVDAEVNLRQAYRTNMPPCVRVVSVDPDGRTIAPDVGQLLQLVSDRRR